MGARWRLPRAAGCCGKGPSVPLLNGTQMRQAAGCHCPTCVQPPRRLRRQLAVHIKLEALAALPGGAKNGK